MSTLLIFLIFSANALASLHGEKANAGKGTERDPEEVARFFAGFDKENNECHERHRKYLDMGCLMKMNKLSQRFNNDELNAETAPDFKKTCKSIQRCYFPLSCSGDEKIIEAVKKVQLHCGLYVFSVTDFIGCTAKLELTNSECYGTWAPYSSKLARETDGAKKEEMKKDFCKLYFGKNNCMKKEVSKICGKQEWIKLRDNFVALNPIINNCKLSDEIFNSD